MPRRPASVTQADVARVIRAVQAAGLPVLRIVLRPDGIAVETTGDANEAERAGQGGKLADSTRVVVI